MLSTNFAFCEVVGVVGNAARQDSPKMVKIGDKMVPVEKVRESVHRASLAKTGGKIRRPNSARGWFVVLNATDIADEKILPALEVIDRRAKVQTKMEKLERYEPCMEKECIAKVGGVLGLVLFSDEKASSLVVAPEDGWAAVNVAPIKNGVADQDVVASRVRKEILRAFAFVSGGAYLSRGDFLMQDVRRPRNLDGLKVEDYGIDMLRKFEEGISFYGLRPWYETTYLKAVQEGWAPNPTNEFQQAIWDKVHAVPTAPMKIEFDPKKGR